MYDYTCIVRNNINTSTTNHVSNENLIYNDDNIYVMKDTLSAHDEREQMYTHENLCIIFNGDIYNSNELLHQLKKENSDCTVASDVELIKELFTTYKENLFQYLRGKFAIVIWDK